MVTLLVVMITVLAEYDGDHFHGGTWYGMLVGFFFFFFFFLAGHRGGHCRGGAWC